MTHEPRPTTRTAVGGDGAEYSFWREHTHINLSPVAAPSILGLFGFAVSTFMVAANLAGWYGDDTTTPLVLAPFAFTFGGVAQFLAAMWSYRARDALATGIHGAWGAFWLAYGIYQLFVGLGGLPGTSASPVAATAFGFWFIGLAAVTWTGTFAAFAENGAVGLVLLTLATGSTLLAISLIAGVAILETIAAYFLLASAALAWYTASAMVLEAAYRRVVLPMGKLGPAPNAPGRATSRAIQFELGEPGIKVGQ
ncbi:acetate uptake transporter [Amycolatopsis sp. OK19-0408]|uniref:Acetate uptake transporter n=1 Tax=Amycolatopsis iheyensis TaxID=2945988 RepID=A0A9X2NM97_9PSEU|nr:acetate uptake transporter [Amycolatopsis iheyensis]MCR6490648.1 acetate uptake transporter [Amycolatopsis iheyensis]